MTSSSAFSKSGVRLVTNKKNFETLSALGKLSKNSLSYTICIVVFTVF